MITCRIFSPYKFIKVQIFILEQQKGYIYQAPFQELSEYSKSVPNALGYSHIKHIVLVFDLDNNI